MIVVLVAVLVIGAAAGWAGAMSATRSERTCCHPYVRHQHGVAQCVLCAACPVDVPPVDVHPPVALGVTDPADATTGA